MTKRKSSRRRRSGFGNIISVRRGVDGLFDTGTVVGDMFPVLAGGLVAVGVTQLIRKMVPAAVGAAGFGTLSAKAVEFAPMVSGVVGAGVGALLVMNGKRSAGQSMMAASLLTGGVMQAKDSVAGFRGFGAIVPEYGMGAMMPQMNGLGATVLEDWSPGNRPDSIGALGDAYGTSVNLSGLGAVNTNAFGTPGFHV